MDRAGAGKRWFHLSVQLLREEGQTSNVGSESNESKSSDGSRGLSRRRPQEN
jgi:hypothetical protein